MRLEIAYNSQPAEAFTGYINPIQPADISDYCAPHTVPETGILYRSNLAPDVANFTSELCGAAGTFCGAIGGWKHAAIVLPKAEAEHCLPVVRFIAKELTDCLDWLPLWRSPAFLTTLELGERYSPRFVPTLRASVVGCVAGVIGGYTLGFLGGKITDDCINGLVKSYDHLAGLDKLPIPYRQRHTSFAVF
jgi:hypothetical protein